MLLKGVPALLSLDRSAGQAGGTYSDSPTGVSPGTHSHLPAFVVLQIPPISKEVDTLALILRPLPASQSYN